MALIMPLLAWSGPLFTVSPGGLSADGGAAKQVLSSSAGTTSAASENDWSVHEHAVALEAALTVRDVELPRGDDVASVDVALVNTRTGSNVVFRGLSPSVGRLRLTRRLLAECRQAGLGSAATFECRVVGRDAGGAARVRRVSSLVGGASVRLPRLRYCQRGQVREVAPAERRLESVSLDVPVPIFVPGVDAATRQRVCHAFYTNALAQGAYRYDYRLPNGDMTSLVDEDAEETVEESESVNQTEASVTEGNFELEEWVDPSNGVIAPSEAAMKVIRAGCKAWDAALYISVPVRVKVGFKSLEATTLGSTYRPLTYYDSEADLVYPAALIDQMRGEDMKPGSADIRICYSSNYAFYLGTDGACPSTKMDLLSIVTHEICHGLGFVSYQYESPINRQPNGTWAREAPSIFDSYLWYGGKHWPELTDAERLASMTSGALYWDGPLAKAAYGGARIPMYAPGEYDPGSSVAHWADDVSSAPLMKHAVSRGEVKHTIEPLLLAAMKDLGWELASERPAVTTYTVTYRPGTYGTGDVLVRTKVANEPLTLSGALYTRSGYTQKGWSTTDGGEKAYELNGTYATDANAVLYPYWQELTASDYEYELESFGVRITGYTGDATAVEIPSTINGYPVREIGYEAFLNSKVESVVVPEGVTAVDSFAFGFCERLQSVSLPSTVTRIGGYAMAYATYESYSGAAFIRSPSLKRIDVAAGNAVYSSSGGVLYNKAKTHLVNYPAALNAGGTFSVPSTVKTISAFAFFGAGPTRITMPFGLLKIEGYAFENAKATSFDLPETVTSVGNDVFLGCAGLEKLVLRSAFATSDSADRWGSNVDNAQIWVAADCYDHWAGVLGQGLSRLEDDVPSGRSDCILSLPCGWSWFSIPVEPADVSLASAFAGVSFADDDMIKSSDGSATYYDGAWYPSTETFGLVAGRAYAVKKSTDGTATVKVSGSAAPTSLAVAAGWNWIGPTTLEAVPLTDLKHSAGFTDDDVINSSGGSATYYDGTWYGELKALLPGVGYKARFGKAGTLEGKGSGR